MAEVTERTDIVETGLRLPLSQFQSKPRWSGMLRVVLEEIQTLETAIVQSIAKRFIQNATGWALEQIGELVGMPRPAYGDAATDDDAYRILIYGQIAANQSHGTLPDLYNLLRALQLTNVRLYNLRGAIVVNYTSTELSETYSFVRGLLERATHPIAFDITSTTSTPFGLLGDDLAYGLGVGHIGASE